MVEAIAAFEMSSTRYSLSPSASFLDKADQGDPRGYTPPTPVPLSFYRCVKCRQTGGVHWLKSRFDPDERMQSHLVTVELTHHFVCHLCREHFEHLQMS